jgi:uncharacterized protein (TIGR03085 family)
MTAPDDLLDAYAASSPAGRAPAVSEVERAQLVETFLAAGPHAPTLSGAWDTHHLVAHLVLRESNPVGAVKAAVPGLADGAVDSLVARSPFDYLVEQFAAGPPVLSFFRLPGNDRRLNGLEHFIHHEDVRRAQDGWARRELPLWAQDQLWKPLRFFAKAITRHAPVPLVLARSDVAEDSVARKGDRPVVVRGLPSELALYVYGRSKVAEYELEGDPEAIERLRKNRFRF